MDFGLSEEQESLQRSARQFLERECPPRFVREVAREPDGFSRRLHAQMATLGWTGLIVPEASGGLGLGMLDMACLLEELGRAAAPGPFFSSSLLATVALRRAPAALRKRWLPAIARGEAVGTVAFLEESGRLDGAGMAARARRMRQGYELDGTKLFVTDAHAADFVVAAFRSAGKGDAGITLFLVPRDTPGVEIRPLDSIDLTRRTDEVVFRRAVVPPASRIGEEGGGWPLVQSILDAGALGLAADSLGGAEKALELSVAYAKVRVQFGKPIGAFQAVKHMAAEMLADIAPARALVWYAAHLCDAAPRQAPRAIAMAKARLSDVYSRVVNRAVQMHGGIGFTWEHDLHFWFKRAAWNHAAFGDPSFHRERVATLAGFSPGAAPAR
jgi:alkylation response protein AidB-like acyl-CoA dehydrogenase